MITVANNLGFANTPGFNVFADSACPNTVVQMSADNGYSSYAWDFGDGNSSSTSSTSNAYTALGTYQISLDITNGCGSVITLNDSVVVHNNVPVLNPNIWEVDSVCPGEQFNNAENIVKAEYALRLCLVKLLCLDSIIIIHFEVFPFWIAGILIVLCVIITC